VKVVVVVEDHADIQLLIQTLFSLDSRFSVAGKAASAEEGLELAQSTGAGLIVLDHSLAGELTGIDAAPRFKEVAPQAKIILFTARAELRARADDEPAIDAFLLKTEAIELLPLAQRLTALGPPSG
jgi:DNA-binding NarL/FixJ family response regulator